MFYLKYLKNLISKFNRDGIPFFMPKFFLGYCISGITSVIILLFIQNILINIISVPFTISQFISTLFALFTSFYLNNYITFKHINNAKTIKKKLIQYFLTNIFTISLNVFIASVVFAIKSEWLISSLIGISSAVIFNFMIYRFKIWKKIR
jgi:putative flippase GtrA